MSVIDVGSSSIKTRRCSDDEGGGVGGAVGFGVVVPTGDLVSSAAMGEAVVGNSVGETEGDTVGLDDGRCDGEMVGMEEIVGEALGQTSGVGLGEIVGKAVGVVDGKSDGLEVGDCERIEKGGRI